jgi:hypothetical protein
MILALIVYLLIGAIFTLLLLEASDFNQELPIRHPRGASIVGIVAAVLFWPILAGIVIVSWGKR